MRKRTLHDTMMLSTGEIARLLAELNRSGKGDHKRRHRRWSFAPQKGVLTLEDDHGEATSFVVVPRNLSRSGMAILHGGFLHTGTRCSVGLRGADGAGRTLSGTVVRCRHISARVHDIGLVFDMEIDPGEFGIEAPQGQRFDAETIEPSALRGIILLVSADPTDLAAIEGAFEETHVEIITASSGEEGLRLMVSEPAAVVADWTLPDMTGLDWLRRIRADEDPTPVLMLTACPEESHRAEAVQAGAREVLYKPLKPRLLQQAMADTLLRSPEDRDLLNAARRIPDDLAPETAAAMMKDFRHYGRELARAVDKDDPLGAEQAARQLRWAAEGTGFDVLLSAAQEAHEGLEAKKKIAPVMAPVRRLIRICEHMRPAPAAPAGFAGVGEELAPEATA